MSCGPPMPAFLPGSPNWSAGDVISAVEAARIRVGPVPFYLYDAPVLPTSVDKEVSVLESCGTPERLYHYGGAYWFLRSLLNHSWRVSSPEEAKLLVIPATGEFQVSRGPGGGGRSQYCKGLTPMSSILSAIRRTASWTARRADHLWVGLDWEYTTIGRMEPGGPPAPSGLLRAFVETRWSSPMTGPFERRSNYSFRDFLIAAPYVDNGDSHPHRNLAERWVHERRAAFAADAERNVRARSHDNPVSIPSAHAWRASEGCGIAWLWHPAS